MFFTDLFLTRGRLPIGSFLMFIGGFSMGSWLTLFHQLQVERDLVGHDLNVVGHHTHEPFLLLVILIISAPRNFDLRDTLRSTWIKLSPGGKSTKHLFVIGTQDLTPDLLRRVEQEHLVHGDLLLLPEIVDSYQNLTLKLTESLTYISSSVPFRYVLKCDDDSFVRVDAVVEELEERQARIRGKPTSKQNAGEKCYFWGFFDGRARVNKKGKWKEEDYNLCDLYIPYALGGGYVINKLCSDFIVRNQATLRTYSNEDVTVGTWLSVISHEKRHDVRFDTEYQSRGCSNKYLVQHKITQAEMIERYQHLVKTGKLCPEEFKRRPSYEYDWTVPPSQCCKRNATII
ncbi:unnamed protein product [Orchesella dallaii]|uniref:Hexosyltransferase n=1 Tax=Orchesella dallaii TaxID=48710 RepID=A0ABP1S3I6_9HEXA